MVLFLATSHSQPVMEASQSAKPGFYNPIADLGRNCCDQFVFHAKQFFPVLFFYKAAQLKSQFLLINAENKFSL
jgi:hypothetical protein